MVFYFDFVRLPAFLICFGLSCFPLSIEGTTLTVTSSTDSNAGGGGTSGDLRFALNTINQTSDTYVLNFNIPSASPTITLSNMLPLLNLNSANSVTINGTNGGGGMITLDGASTYNGFFARQGTITIQNMAIQNCLSRGGNGGEGAAERLP